MSALLRRAIQAAVLAVLVAAWVADFTTTFPTQLAVIYTLPGSAFAITGLIAWSLRPANRVGPLMLGVGVGLLAGTGPVTRFGSTALEVILIYLLSRVGVLSLLIYVYLALAPLWAVVLLHLLLAFPGGRLSSRLSRGLIGALYAFVPLIGLIGQYRLSFVVVLHHVPIDYSLVLSVLIQACFAVGFILIMKRWIQGGQARRRSLGPVLWSLAPLSVAFLVPTLLGVLPWVVISPDNPAPADPRLVAFLNDLGPLSSFLLIVLPIAILIGLLRSGLDMTSVAGLVVKLSKGLLPDQLQPALANVLHDPSLEVLYWVPALDAFADLTGKPEDLPGPDSERAAAVLDGASSPVAALVYDSSLLHEPQLVDTAAAAVRMALENAQLQVQLRAQLEEVRQSRARLVEAGQMERQRVERDLHDGAQQQLVALLLAMQSTKVEAVQHADTATAVMLDANISDLKQALNELRELARGIHPSILTEAGLVPAIRSLADRCPLPVEVTVDEGDVRMAPQLEATLYFVVAEAITNAVKHSSAKQIRITLRRAEEVLAVDVRDDGQGGADLSLGSGLRGLSDRVSAVGGRLQVTSDGRHGTTVHGEVPCE